MYISKNYPFVSLIFPYCFCFTFNGFLIYLHFLLSPFFGFFFGLPFPVSYLKITLLLYFLIFVKDFYLFIYFYTEGKGEREGGKHHCVVASCMPPTGDLACNPGMCPDWEWNEWPFGSPASTQSTETYQPDLFSFLFFFSLVP